MTILLLDQFVELGGAQRCLLDLLPAIEHAGWKGHAALPRRGPLTERLENRGVPVHPLSLHNYSSGHKGVWDGVRFIADLRTVSREISELGARLKPAVIYVNGPRLMPAVARAGVGVPVVFHAHNLVSAGNGAAVLARALRKTNATVIAASRFLARRLCGHVVYSGVDAQTHPRTRGPVPRVGMMGRIAPQKRQKEFVQAAARCPQAEFVLCGDVLFGDRRAEGYKQELLPAASSNVLFLGWRDDVSEVLSTLDLLVVPSAEEGGVTRVILEAFAARVPVLALASGAIPEVVIDGENGFLLRSGSAVEIAQRCRELLSQPDRLTAVAERAHGLWGEKFTVERYRAEVWNLVINCWKTSAAASPTAAVPTRAAG